MEEPSVSLELDNGVLKIFHVTTFSKRKENLLNNAKRWASGKHKNWRNQRLNLINLCFDNSKYMNVLYLRQIKKIEYSKNYNKDIE